MLKTNSWSEDNISSRRERKRLPENIYNKYSDLRQLFDSLNNSSQEIAMNKRIDLEACCRKLNKFSPIAYRIFVSAFFSGMSLFRIAVSLGMSERFVSKVYQKSLRKVWMNLVDYI